MPRYQYNITLLMDDHPRGASHTMDGEGMTHTFHNHLCSTLTDAQDRNIVISCTREEVFQPYTVETLPAQFTFTIDGGASERRAMAIPPRPLHDYALFIVTMDRGNEMGRHAAHIVLNNLNSRTWEIIEVIE